MYITNNSIPAARRNLHVLFTLQTHYVCNDENFIFSLNTVNEGRVAVGDLSGIVPCTPNGAVELIKRSGVKIAGTETVVLGRSKIVGTPVSELLKWHHATVTVCHSKTKNLEEQVKYYVISSEKRNQGFR